MKETIAFRLNGAPRKIDVDPGRPLLWVIRSDLGLTGTKYGCGEGLCGACTVLLDGRAVRSCQTQAGEIRGKKLTTIEGLAPGGLAPGGLARGGGRLHPLQEAFAREGALQCGFCTPGMILAAVDLLRSNPHPTREEIVRAMEPNLCRCGAHQRILGAIEAAAAASSPAPAAGGGAR